MRKELSILASFALATTAFLGGCKQSPTPATPAQQTPSQATIPSNGTVAPSGQPVVPANTPAPTTAPATTAVAPAPAPAVAATEPSPASEAPPAAAARRVVESVPAGTRVVVAVTETLKASTNDVGDRFTGSLAESLRSKGGATVFPRGTRVVGTVIAAKGRGRFKGAGGLGIELTSIGGSRVSTTEYEKAEKGKGKRTGALIGGGAGLGAIIGGLAGGGKGALIGGLAGAGAGTAGAAYTGNHDVVIPSESVITFRLRDSVSR